MKTEKVISVHCPKCGRLLRLRFPNSWEKNDANCMYNCAERVERLHGCNFKFRYWRDRESGNPCIELSDYFKILEEEQKEWLAAADLLRKFTI